MTYLLIFAASALFAMQTLAMKKLRSGSLAGQLFLNAAFTGLGALLLALYGLFDRAVFAFGGRTALYGLAFGVLYAGAVLCYLLALLKGPVALSAFYLSASMLIPALFGILFLHEKITPLKGIGIALLVFSMYLAQAGEKKARPQTRGRAWLALCMGAFCLNGLLSVSQKCQQMATGGTEGFGLMLVGYAAAGVLDGLAAFALSRKAPFSARELLCANRLALPAVTVCSLSGNLILTFLAAKVDSVLLYPMSQGGLLVLLALLSALVFHEKNGLRAVTALALGIVALALLA